MRWTALTGLTGLTALTKAEASSAAARCGGRDDGLRGNRHRDPDRQQRDAERIALANEVAKFERTLTGSLWIHLGINQIGKGG